MVTEYGRTLQIIPFNQPRTQGPWSATILNLRVGPGYEVAVTHLMSDYIFKMASKRQILVRSISQPNILHREPKCKVFTFQSNAIRNAQAYIVLTYIVLTVSTVRESKDTLPLKKVFDIKLLYFP